MKVIGLCGRAGAGKSTLVNIIKEQFPDVQVISTGDAVRQSLARSGIEPNHYNLQKVTNDILAARGDNFISIVFELIDPKFSFVLLDSFRRVQDVSCVTKAFGKPFILFVDSPKNLRFDRLIARRRNSDPADKAAFSHLTELEDSWGVNDLFRTADLTLHNLGSPEEFRQQATIALRRAFHGILAAKEGKPQ